MFFRDIIGQQTVKEHILRLVQENRLPHALMLWGNEGVGKLPLALAMAQYLLCSNKQGGDACGTCLSCKQMSKLIHPDLHFVFPIVKSSTEPKCDDFLEEWRDMVLSTRGYFLYDQWIEKIGEGKQGQIYAAESDEIIRKLSYKSFQGDCKVMIIWLPEKMNVVCANKLLKLLEEPPEKTYFILVSEQPEQLLSTIVSRTQMVHVPCIAMADMEASVGEVLARVANGNYVKALTIQQQAGSSQPHFELYRQLMLAVVMIKLPQLKAWAEQLNDSGREEIKRFLQYAQRITRECFMLHFGLPAINYLEPHEQAFAAKFINYLNANNIEFITHAFAKAYEDIEQNGNGKIVLFDMGLQLMTKMKL